VLDLIHACLAFLASLPAGRAAFYCRGEH
jgi:hypothetical protein